MSPEPTESEINLDKNGGCNESSNNEESNKSINTKKTEIDTNGQQANSRMMPTTNTPTKDISHIPTLSRKQRERKNLSLTTVTLLNSLADPSTTVSESQVNDDAFEPTIEMWMNDFDDEQTLNEEEALAESEQQDPHVEISTLQEEGEMPLEELLAKYQSMPRTPPPPPSAAPPRKKNSKSKKSKKSKKLEASSNVSPQPPVTVTSEQNSEISENTIENTKEETPTQHDVIVIESGDDEENHTNEIEPAKVNEECEEDETDVISEASGHTSGAVEPTTTTTTEEHCSDCGMEEDPPEKKQRRSYLLDLYPEKIFPNDTEGGENAFSSLYEDDDEDDDDDDDDEEDEEEDLDTDYMKKSIMVGPAYQAVIPNGLSKYGDVLPYENEDKLIWEPTQVSEREVEEYLMKTRDIRPNSSDEEPVDNNLSGDEIIMISRENDKNKDAACSDGGGVGGEEENCDEEILRNGNPPVNIAINNTSTTNNPSASAQQSNNDMEPNGLVKDNEQALHLLVQCGYDFKEALRRKRLNALPLTDSMSLWSEEECQKFEEGIQKFGKDFLKIRQNQVRTRTMRELVHFYYLWKKSERRDHNFANSDTVDHMDMYLNEGGDYGSNSTTAATTQLQVGGGTTLGNVVITTNSTMRKISPAIQKNISIMTVSNPQVVVVQGSHNINSTTSLSPTTTTITTPPTTTATTSKGSSNNSNNKKRCITHGSMTGTAGTVPVTGSLTVGGEISCINGNNSNSNNNNNNNNNSDNLENKSTC